jgi:hypothetical protein
MTRRAAQSPGEGGSVVLLPVCPVRFGALAQQVGLLSCVVCTHLKLRSYTDVQIADKAATLSAAAVHCPARRVTSQALAPNPSAGCSAPVHDTGVF